MLENMGKRRRETIDLDNLPPEVLNAIIVTLRDSEDQTDYLLFHGRHVAGMNLLELGERFGNSAERMRQRLNELYERINAVYTEMMGTEDFTVAGEQ